ncbi:MAG: phytoene desaturase family protein [Actinobacteria bacterium]|nr:phytoene desaturase family protein [Actinomycetota bacterium]
MSEQSGEIVVIGAGIGGLAAATRLAKAGFKVKIFEASSQPGGKCRTININGYSFDTGPSLLTLPAVYRDLFLKSGKHLGQVLKVTPVEPAFDYFFPDGTRLTLPSSSRAETSTAIEKSFGRKAAIEWEDLMKRAEKMWAVSREPFVESELGSITSLIIRPKIFADLFTIAPWRSLRSLVNRKIRDPHLRTLIDRYATYTGSDPRKAPAVLLTIPYVEMVFGAWHIGGGIGRLGQALAERAENCGALIEYNCPVSQILTSDGKVTGVKLNDGRIIDSQTVISNADSELTYGTLLGDLAVARKEKRKIMKSEPSLSGFYLTIGLKGKRSNLNHHTISFPENYDAEFDAVFKDFQPVADPTLYICSPQDEQMVPNQDLANHESLFVLVNAPRHSKNGNGFDWSTTGVAKKYADHLVDLLVSKGFIERERIEVLEYGSPLQIENNHLAPGGSIYGRSSNGARAAFGRAKNRSPIDGLYLVGGSAHPGGGLPLVGLSGEIVAGIIAQRSKGNNGLWAR